MNKAIEAVDILLKFAKRDFAPEGLDEQADLIREALQSMQWRPISEAPRDGTSILITDGKYVEKAKWANCDERFEGEEWQWLIFECEDGYYNITADADEPTHFMPLPPAPQGDE